MRRLIRPVNRNHEVTVPAADREVLDIEPGDMLELKIINVDRTTRNDDE